MKRLILILAVVAMVLPGCKKINEALDSLDNRLDKLEQETIPSIDEQIAAINVSLDSLNAMDKELKGYIEGLTATATNLQEQINATNTKIDEVKAELKGDISSTETELKGEIETAKASVIAQLESAKAELEVALAQINSTIVILQAKDAEIEGKIAELKTYVDTELGKTTDWVNATFATLEQYNALVSEVATIKEQIKAINQSVADLETRLTTKINEDIATAVSALNADIQQKVKEITEAYTAAIKTAKEEITAAYTTAIQTAINALDASLKAWVGNTLSNYYTIAEVEALLATLKLEVDNKLDVQKVYLEGLINELSATMAKSIADNKALIVSLRNDVISLQGKSAEYATKIAENAGAIAENAQAIIDNSASIAQNADDVEANAKLIADNKTIIETNSKAIAENKNAIDALKSSVSTAIAQNATDIVQNASNIAKNAVFIAQNATAISNSQLAISQNSADILQLQQYYANIENELEEICQEVIRDAIGNSGGVISSVEALSLNTRIDNEIATFNYQVAIIATRVSVLENEVATIKQQVATMLADVADLKDSVSKLLDRIQSVSYIPTYDDGKATVENSGVDSQIILDFEVSPKNTISELVKVWQEAVSIQAVYTQTRAVSFIDMPIMYYDADAENGVISFVVSGRNLSNNFFDGTQTASVRLSISDGNNSIVSQYIPLEIRSVIEYTTSNDRAITPASDTELEIVSNTYDTYNRVGKMVLAGRLTAVPMYIFRSCTTLTSITIPGSVRAIGVSAFQSCNNLKTIKMLSTMPPILSSNALPGASSGLMIYVPAESVALYQSAWKTYKDNICSSTDSNNYTIKYTTSDRKPIVLNREDFGATILSNTYDNGEGVILFDGDVTTIGKSVFENCSTLSSITIPNSVAAISDRAFYGCKSLASIVFPSGVTKIGEFAFVGCDSLMAIYFTSETRPVLSIYYDEAEDTGYSPFPANKGMKCYVPKDFIESYQEWSSWWWPEGMEFIVF